MPLLQTIGLVKKYGGYVGPGALPESVTWRFQGDGSVQVGDACGRRGTFGGLGSLSVANAPRENFALRRTPQELQSQVERCGDATVTADHFTPNAGALPSDRLVTRFTVTAFSPALGLEGARNAVNVCLRVQPHEKVTLITDEACLDIAAALASEVERAGARYQSWTLEDVAPPLSTAAD